MADTIKLSIITPERRLADSIPVRSLSLTGTEGHIQILPGHVPMLGSLDVGGFEYVPAVGEATAGVISAGFFQVDEESVTVMAETLELRTEIDVARAKRAQEKAESALREAALDEGQFRKYQLKLQRALIRQQFGSRRG